MEEFDPGDGDEEYWKMQDFQNYSKSYESNGKLSWIWRKGVNLGKKMVLTGVVVSSVCIVLPPLVALSAVGVAFSVPAGFVFATYACGNKLLNMILPRPMSTPFEDNGTICCDEEEYRVYRDDVDKGYEETGDLEVEEQEFEEDIKKGLEMRIELVEENDREINDYEQTLVDKDELDKRSSEVSEIVEEEYEENAGDNVADEEQPLDSKATHEILEGIIEAEDEISSMEKEDGGITTFTRVSEIVEEGYEEDYVGVNIADEEQPLDSKAIPEILEVIKVVENDINLMEKEEGRMLRVFDEIDGEGYEEEVGEYMADEEQPLDSKAVHEILEGIIEEETEFSSMEKEDGGMEKVSEIVEEGYEEDVGEYIADEEQPLDSKANPEIPEGIKEVENEINLMEKEEGRMLRVTEIDGEGYAEDVGEYSADEEQPLDSKAIPEILEGIKEVENEFSSMENEDGGMERVSEIVEEGYEEDVGEYIADEEQPLDSKANPEILEGIKEVENDITLMGKEEGRMLRVTEIDGEGYAEEVGEYTADEEQFLDSKANSEILEGIKEVENEFSSVGNEDGGMERVSEIVEEGYEEDVGEYMADEEQPLDSNAITEILEGIKEEVNEINLMEKEEGRMLGVIEIDGERYEDVGEYMTDEEQPLDSKEIHEILEGTKEVENEISLLEKEEGEMPKDSYREFAVATQLDGENEIDVELLTDDMVFVPPRDIKEEREFAGSDEDKLNIETMQLFEDTSDEGKYDQKREDSPLEETTEENEESRIVPEKDMSEDKENKNLTVPEEVELATDDKGVIIGLESETNVEQVKEDMASVSPRNLKEENGSAGVEMVLIEKMRDEGKNDQKRKDSPAKETLKGNEESGIVSVKDMLQDMGNKNLTIPKEVVPAIDDKGVLHGVKSENNAEQEMEGMAFVLTTDIKEENEFAGVEGEELKRETTGLIEKMRDEGKDDEKQKDNTAKETPEGNEESGRVVLKDMSQDKENKNLTLNPEGLEPAMDDKGLIVDLENDVFLGNISNEGDESKSAVEDQLEVNVKIDDDHTVTEIHQGTGSDKRGTLILSEEDTREEAVESGVDLSHNGTVALAGVEEEELKRETTGLIEKVRDEGKHGEKRKDNTAKGIPEGNEESGRVILKDMSQDKENKNLTLIPEGHEPAMDDKGPIVDLKSNVFVGNISNEGDESKSAVEDHLEVNVKIDGDHTATEVHQGTGSDKIGTLILYEEDTWEDAESGFDLSDNGTVAPHHIADSFDKLPEGEGQSLNKMVEVTVDYHEFAIESTMPVPELLGEDQSLNKMVEITSDYHEVAIESTMPVSEHSETALDQGSTAGSDKVKPDEEKVWEEINAMRTIVGYAYTPHRTCAEELKALYDFTGVELPASSNDPADLADINEKLHFLMSIVGVK